MCRIVIAICFTVFYGGDFLQDQEKVRERIVTGKNSGDTIRGKNAIYKLQKIDKYKYCRMRNANILDSTWFGDRVGKYISTQNGKKIKETVCKCIKPENIVLPQKSVDVIYLGFTLNEDYKIERVTFGFGWGDLSEFWVYLPVDCYCEIERELMKLELSFDEKEKREIREMDVERGEYYFFMMHNQDVCDFWNVEVKDEMKQDLLEEGKGI